MDLKKHTLAMATVLALVLLGTASWLTQAKIEEKHRAEIGKSLTAVLNTTHQAVRTWFKDQGSAVELWANNHEVVKFTGELMALPPTPEALVAAPAQAELRKWLKPVFRTIGYRGFFIIGPDDVNLASTRDSNIGVKSLLSKQAGFLDKVKSGRSLMSLPQPSDVPLRDLRGEMVEGLPTMFVAAPIRDEAGKVIAVLAFRIEPDEAFSAILERGRIGSSGETYAFDSRGLLISESRFNQQLQEIGLISDNRHSDLKVEVRDPGVDLTRGKRPALPRHKQPLTRMARSATAGESGMDMDGYRDYRGVPVVGVWLWDSEFGFGMTTEIDVGEDFAALSYARFLIFSFIAFTAALMIVLATVFYRGRTRLFESEERSRLILESAGEGIYGLDLTGRTTFVNPAVTHMLGYTADELIGQPMHALVHHSHPDGSPYPREDCPIYAAFTDGMERHVKDEVLWRKDGTRVPIEYTSTPIRKNGELAGAVVTFRDVTERKEAEERLHQSRELLSAAIENIADGFVLCDADNRIVLFNKKFGRLYPNSRDAIFPGARFEDFLRAGAERGEYPDALEDVDAWLAARLAKGRQRGEAFEQPLIGERWARVAVNRLPDGGWVGIHVDITELKHARQQADAANKAKSDFLSSMSHELRTPLNAILGFAQLLEFNRKEPLTEAQRGCVDHILKGGQHLLELINEVLDLAKIEAGKVDLFIENVRTADVLDECLSLMATIAEERGISLSVAGDAEERRPIRADFVRFKQVLLNLLSNAVKYNRDGGTVTIDFQETGEGMLRIGVTDTGEGIPKEKQEELFRPFSRLGAENTEIEGTGIGLSVTKQLVELMNGSIGFESTLGKGSTFWIALPRALDDAAGNLSAAGKPRKEAAARPLDGDKTLLYVEDNPANLKLMELIVSRVMNLSIISAHSAELGIELAKTRQPDLIILDINLPGMDGIDALKELRRSPETRNIPVLALSAAATVRDIEKGIEAGFLHYLTKPIMVEEVLASIRHALRST